MLAKSVHSKIDINYQSLADQKMKVYYQKFSKNNYNEDRRMVLRDLRFFDEYASVDQDMTLFIENEKFIGPNILINGLHYIWKRLFIQMNIKYTLQNSDTTKRQSFIHFYIYKNNIFEYDQEIEIGILPQRYKKRRIVKKGQKIYQIIDTDIKSQKQSQVIINKSNSTPLKVKVMDIRNAILKNKQFFNNLFDLFDEKCQFSKIAPDRNCIIYNDKIINNTYNIREIPYIGSKQFSKCSNILTCRNGNRKFYIIEVSTLQDLFTIDIQKENSEIFFDFEKSILTETIENIQYETFVYIVMESSVQRTQQLEIL